MGEADVEESGIRNGDCAPDVRLFGARTGEGGKDPAAAPATATDAGGAAQKTATSDPNYVIGGQDVLDISVWKEAELTRDGSGATGWENFDAPAQ